jgi:hypothetical protein
VRLSIWLVSKLDWELVGSFTWLVGDDVDDPTSSNMALPGSGTGVDLVGGDGSGPGLIRGSGSGYRERLCGSVHGDVLGAGAGRVHAVGDHYDAAGMLPWWERPWFYTCFVGYGLPGGRGVLQPYCSISQGWSTFKPLTTKHGRGHYTDCWRDLGEARWN